VNPLLLLGGGLLAYLATKGGDSGPAQEVIAAAEDATAESDDEISNSAAEEDVVADNTPEIVAAYVDAVNAAVAGTRWDPYILLGIGWRESQWGTSPQLHPSGPGGTGDFLMRDPSRTTKLKRVMLVQGVYPPWSATKALQASMAAGGSAAVPDDSLGWGRGIMQIDWGRAQGIDWADPETNIREAVKVLNEKYKVIAPAFPMSEPELQRAAVAAYNTGEGNVLKSLRGKQGVDTMGRTIPGREAWVGRSYQTDGIDVVDLTTVARFKDAPMLAGTGGNYSAAVMVTAANWKGGNV
jgi:hypothetical protein